MNKARYKGNNISPCTISHKCKLVSIFSILFSMSLSSSSPSLTNDNCVIMDSSSTVPFSKLMTPLEATHAEIGSSALNYPKCLEPVVKNTKSAFLNKLLNVNKREEKSSRTWASHSDCNLADILNKIAFREFASCFLTIVFDKDYPADSTTLDQLVKLPHEKQVIKLGESNVSSLQNIQWKSSLCQGYIFLLTNGEEVIQHMNSFGKAWNHLGSFVLAAPQIEIIMKLSDSENGKKTENIIGLVPSTTSSAWSIYVKRLFSTPSMTVMSRQEKSTLKSFFSDTTTNFKGKTFKLVTFEWNPYVFYDRNEQNEVIDYYGMDIAVLKTLSKIFNFKIKYMEPPANEYFGGELPDGNWTGLVGTIARNEADMAAVDLYYTLSRAEVVDYSGPISVESTCFLAKKASPYPLWKSLLFPFKLKTWIASLVVLIACALTMYSLELIIWKFNIIKGALKPGVECVFLSFDAHVRQPTSNLFKGQSVKVFLLFLWLYSFIVTTAYSSNLTAFLTIQRVPKTLETVRELKESGLHVGGVGPNIEVESISEDFKVLFSRFVGYPSVKDALKEVLKGSAVVYLSKPTLEYASISTLFDGQEDPKRTLRIINECFSSFATGIYVQKNSPLKKKFDDVIGRMTQAGLIRKWFLDSLNLSNQRKLEKLSWKSSNATLIQEEPKNYDRRVVSLSIQHLQGIFMILILGHLLATIVFFTEIVYGVKKNISN